MVKHLHDSWRGVRARNMRKAARIGVAAVVASALLTSTNVAYGAQPQMPDNQYHISKAVVSDNDATGDAMPDNPDVALPQSVSAAIPDDATVVSGDLAATDDGEIKDLATGRTVNDPALVGTTDTPPDPLAKTDGKSFIPVDVAEVRDAIESSAAADDASETDAAATGAAVMMEVETGDEHRVRAAQLSGNRYGAYWGTYNGAPAMFGSDGKPVIQNAKGVVDVSYYNGTNIDWSAAKKAGVEGAIIRVGYGIDNVDDTARRNIAECKRLGIPFGVYWYSYAYDERFAADEGDSLAKTLRDLGVSNNDLSYPAFYDLEQWTWTGHTPPTTPAAYEKIVNNWYARMKANGYTNLSLYSYTSYLNGPLASKSIWKNVTWVGQYAARMHFNGWTSDKRGWQYTSEGRVAGIDGNVDMSAFGVRPGAQETAKAVPIYRVYNRNSGLHHYTANAGEMGILVRLGWRAENSTSFSAATRGMPVYREYNRNNGTHNWTLNWYEHRNLVKRGWRDEGVAWYSPNVGTRNVYRLYNPNSGEHVYTTSYGEYRAVGAKGWHMEGVAWKSSE